ncbi:alpha/beta fold hydrolase [Flagellatimonas centrodinii]|uniref:alpha/beta hydrolase n=1 Tax=Flagellatimonas centrodinii TaxID=2806210 RepID=UPI001FED6017|nr:alpha/beta fold hydrolase [Flagellatimonas centrodinii]ULQ48154.1 alpha/beta fold hydrolase [Flagellatimonas centrodinii]
MHLTLDTGLTLPGEPPLTVAASLWWPRQPPTAVLVCLPGGNMNRRYYDLQVAGAVPTFSFAEAMVAEGFLVAALDHLGVGDSSRPEDGWVLTPELLTAANAAAVAALLTGLRSGTLVRDRPSLPALRALGVGHSMGAMMTLLLQAASAPFAGLALLGFATRGLPQFAPPPLRDTTDPDVLRPQLTAIAKSMFGTAYPRLGGGGGGGNRAELYGSAQADPRGVAALKAATDNLLPVPATLSMAPGNVATEARAVDVPVFIGVGERDMTGPPEAIPASFPASPAVTLEVLPDTGHSHFLFPSRSRLFARLGAWARDLMH